MERNEQYEHFEQFLKDSVEDFRMYPSGHVWSSLYNNLHPGRKWPSLAVLLFMLSSILYIGFTHNQPTAINEVTKTDNNNLPGLLALNERGLTKGDGKNLSATSPLSQFDVNEHLSIASNTATTDKNSTNNQTSTITSLNNVNAYSNNNTIGPAQLSAFVSWKKTRRSPQTNVSTTQPEPSYYVQHANNQHLGTGTDREGDNKNIFVSLHDDEEAWGNSENISTDKLPTLMNPISSTQVDEAGLQDKAWMEDYAFYNKPKSKFNSKLTYQLYVTPSIGFRSMSKNAEVVIPISSFAPGNIETAPKFNHTPALNLEAGYSALYSLSTSVRIKSGFQLNYSNFRIHAQDMNHPTATSLLLNNLSNGGTDLVFRPSSISNSYGDESRNYNTNSFQISIPIGADVRIAGKNNLQWFVGATIQPTYVLSGNAFLVSADMKNYVVDNSFIRKWNMNAGFETFVTYKLNSAITLNAGPQFRYQLRSTYSNRYTFDERMYNIGLKLGVTQQF